MRGSVALTKHGHILERQQNALAANDGDLALVLGRLGREFQDATPTAAEPGRSVSSAFGDSSE